METGLIQRDQTPPYPRHHGSWQARRIAVIAQSSEPFMAERFDQIVKYYFTRKLSIYFTMLD
jgi:hypothetical protein